MFSDGEGIIMRLHMAHMSDKLLTQVTFLKCNSSAWPKNLEMQ